MSNNHGAIDENPILALEGTELVHYIGWPVDDKRHTTSNMVKGGGRYWVLGYNLKLLLLCRMFQYECCSMYFVSVLLVVTVLYVLPVVFYSELGALRVGGA